MTVSPRQHLAVCSSGRVFDVEPNQELLSVVAAEEQEFPPPEELSPPAEPSGDLSRISGRLDSDPNGTRLEHASWSLS